MKGNIITLQCIVAWLILLAISTGITCSSQVNKYNREYKLNKYSLVDESVEKDIFQRSVEIFDSLCIINEERIPQDGLMAVSVSDTLSNTLFNVNIIFDCNWNLNGNCIGYVEYGGHDFGLFGNDKIISRYFEKTSYAKSFKSVKPDGFYDKSAGWVLTIHDGKVYLLSIWDLYGERFPYYANLYLLEPRPEPICPPFLVMDYISPAMPIKKFMQSIRKEYPRSR